MLRINCNSNNWLPFVLEAIRDQGCAVVEGALAPAMLADARAAMYRAQKKIHEEVGYERLQQAGELGVLRLMLKFEPIFLSFLEIKELLAIVDNTVSSTAILHLQNGFVLPSLPPDKTPSIFQNRFHQDFPRVFNGYMASINVMFAIDEFTASNGATVVALGTQQRVQAPDPLFLESVAVPVEAPPGSMIVFDSTLWHKAGVNTSGNDRLAINHQFTRSVLKQQIDYVRALGDAMILAQQPRTRQLLGWATRVVSSLDEYYQPEGKRLYQRGQG
jgi:ectoine hydroxylase-related dioxygenase (phytanoyl-CoA dioxygenase family)